MNYIDNNRLRQLGFLAVLILIGYVLFQELSSFIPAFLGAITFYVMMRNTMNKLVYKRKWKRGSAAFVLMFVSFLVVLIPIWVLVSLLSSKVGYAIQNSNQLLAVVQKYVHQLELTYHVQILSPDNIDKASGFMSNSLRNILAGTFDTILAIVIMYFILYFMLVKSKEMEEYLYEYIPLKDENITWIGKEMNTLVYNNAIGVPMIAFLQGVVGLVGYLIFGAPDPWFWFVITAITSMLPFVGAAAAYVPYSILIFSTGPAWKGWAILAWGFLVVGLVDNVFRIVVQKKLGDVHPLITVFGVLIGINLFGFIGLIFGPILIAMFLLLIRIYINEFATKRSTRAKV
jgi:predicted PurR-regulated permease PerM